jgi:phage shock protein C
MKKKFQLDRRNGKFMGVCAGLANYTGLDATVIRIALVVVTILGAFPWTLIAYGAAAWIAKPRSYSADLAEDAKGWRTSTHDMRSSMRDIDHRMAEVDTYVAQSNSSLAQEIEKLR